MKFTNPFVVLLLLCLFGCSEQNGNEEEKVYSQITKDKTLALIESASVITSGTETGMNFMTYSKAVDKYSSDLDMLTNFLPEDFNPNVKETLVSAKRSWVLTRTMWAKKIDRGAEDYYTVGNWAYNEPPGAPELWLAALVKDDEGYPYYSSIGTTLGVGGVYFEIAKPSLLKILK